MSRGHGRQLLEGQVCSTQSPAPQGCQRPFNGTTCGTVRLVPLVQLDPPHWICRTLFDLTIIILNEQMKILRYKTEHTLTEQQLSEAAKKQMLPLELFGP